MIVDDLAQQYPSVRQNLEGAHIVRVPFPVCERSVRQTGDFGIAVTASTVPASLIPHDRKTGHIDATGLRAPYPLLVLASAQCEQGFFLVHTTPIPDAPEGVEYVQIIELYRKTADILLAHSWSSLFGIDGKVKPGLPLLRLLTPTGEIAPYSDNLREAVRAIADDHMELKCMANGWAVAELKPEWTAAFDRCTPDSIVAWATSLRGMANEASMTVAATFALMNARNVVQESINPSPALQAARRRRGQLPLYQHHVLKVRQLQGRRGTGLIGTGSPVAIHWTRGHFKQYTAERRLFGKHTGLYWWQAHLAGRAPRVVTKDYALVPAEAAPGA